MQKLENHHKYKRQSCPRFVCYLCENLRFCSKLKFETHLKTHGSEQIVPSAENLFTVNVPENVDEFEFVLEDNNL